MLVYAAHTPTLFHVLSHYNYNEVCILSPNLSVILFCKNIGIDYYEIPILKSYRRTDLIKHKIKLIEIAEKFVKKTLYFEHSAHDYWGLYLIGKLSFNNNILFDDPLSVDNETCNFFKALIKSKKSRRLFIDVFIIFFISGILFNIINDGNTYTIGIKKQRILKKYKYQKLSRNKKVYTTNQNFILNKYGLKNKKLIFADQGEIIFKIPNEVINVITNLFDKNDLYLKEHPRILTTNKLLLSNFNKLPNEIPLEFLIKKDTILIGVCSSTLNFFNSISLIKLVEFKNEKMKKNFEGYINHKYAKTPICLKSLKDILRNYED